MYVRGSDSVPGATSQRTRFEGVNIEGRVDDYHFHNFEWQTTDHPAGGLSTGRLIPAQVLDLGFASIPNNHCNAIWEAHSYSSKSTGVRNLSQRSC